jgi:hypothetical protein
MASNTGDDPFLDPRDPLLVNTSPSHTPLNAPSHDPLSQPPEHIGGHMSVPDTLAVGRSASLTFGTDSLIVLGMHSAQTSRPGKADVLQMKTSSTAKAQTAVVCLLLAVSATTHLAAQPSLTHRREQIHPFNTLLQHPLGRTLGRRPNHYPICADRIEEIRTTGDHQLRSRQTR